VHRLPLAPYGSLRHVPDAALPAQGTALAAPGAALQSPGLLLAARGRQLRPRGHHIGGHGRHLPVHGEQCRPSDLALARRIACSGCEVTIS
jgi:hypothetical protein